MLRAARLPLWALALAAAIAYITLITGDAYLLRVPLKLYLVAVAIGAWWLQVGRHASWRDYPLGAPVLAFAVVISIAWSLVALLHSSGEDPTGLHQLSWTLQEDSRFVYVLLFFPLLDARRLFGERGDAVWLLPVFALAIITVALFLTHYLIGKPDDTISYLVFKGVFEAGPGGFRVFIGNQVLFITAMALLLAQLAMLGTSRARTGALALLIVSSYLSHTRGIWLGLSVVCAGVLVVTFWSDLREGQRRLVLSVGGVVVAIAALVGIAMLAGVAPRPSFLEDASAGSRVSQAPKLWHAFLQNPVFGDGLGSVIRPKFVRDASAPWSYELTYLQLLFQLGVVGTLAVIALPLAGIWRGIRSMVGREAMVAPTAGAMGILGVLVASATNPYLLSSFGMLGITIGLALVASRSEPVLANREVGDSG